MKATFRERMHETSDDPQWDWVLAGDNGEPLSRSTESYDDKRDMLHCFELTTGTKVQTVKNEENETITAAVKPGSYAVIEVEWEILAHD